MPPVVRTPEQVVDEVHRIVQHAIDRLSDSSVRLHEQGYHKWSSEVSNLRFKLERAQSETIDNVMDS